MNVTKVLASSRIIEGISSHSSLLKSSSVNNPKDDVLIQHYLTFFDRCKCVKVVGTHIGLFKSDLLELRELVKVKIEVGML